MSPAGAFDVAVIVCFFDPAVNTPADPRPPRLECRATAPRPARSYPSGGETAIHVPMLALREREEC